MIETHIGKIYDPLLDMMGEIYHWDNGEDYGVSIEFEFVVAMPELPNDKITFEA
jgi:hypothetical protein